MGYYANAADRCLSISDKDGLLAFLRKESPHMVPVWKDEEEELFRRLQYCLPVEEVTGLYEDGSIEFYSDEKYRRSWWEPFAPYLKGYVEWRGEDNCIWCDAFNGKIMETFYPEIIWPEEMFEFAEGKGDALCM